MPDVLVAVAVGKTFGVGAGALRALDDVSLTMAEGELVSIIGPSGCGKSTFLNIVGGLVGPYEGDVRVAGEAVQGPPRAIGMVFQEESTFPWRTVLGNVAFGLEMRGVGRLG